jgi:hypothetical protein
MVVAAIVMPTGATGTVTVAKAPQQLQGWWCTTLRSHGIQSSLGAASPQTFTPGPDAIYQTGSAIHQSIVAHLLVCVLVLKQQSYGWWVLLLHRSQPLVKVPLQHTGVGANSRYPSRRTDLQLCCKRTGRSQPSANTRLTCKKACRHGYSILSAPVRCFLKGPTTCASRHVDDRGGNHPPIHPRRYLQLARVTVAQQVTRC